ncbi:MAG: dipicolinate synthase subunit B [Clostridia bacterium]|nr:MAG: dipicolinate synthase subunit B [Clostridia bacterium]
MELAGKKVGFALTGSHCTFAQVWPQLQTILSLGAEVIPIVSPAAESTDTRFGPAAEWMRSLTEMAGRQPIKSIVTAEPIGPKKLLDILVIAPCTGNTLAKLANGITDTAVLMAAKACIRNQRPVVLAIATNDGLGMNARNLGVLLNTRHIYFVPFGQDDPAGKVSSLVAHMELLPETVAGALEGRQVQPVLRSY